MIDVNALKAEWVRNGLTQYQVAENILGISSRGFHEKLKKGILGSDEIEKLVIALNISKPMPIFFPRLVTCEDTTTKAPT